MGNCWYCYWGWAGPVAAIYQKALKAIEYSDPLTFGPAHIVWADENFENAEWCLEHFDEYSGDYSEQDLDIVKQSLIELAALPLEIRCVCPDDYDDNNPQKYPPPDGVEMVKV